MTEIDPPVVAVPAVPVVAAVDAELNQKVKISNQTYNIHHYC